MAQGGFCMWSKGEALYGCNTKEKDGDYYLLASIWVGGTCSWYTNPLSTWYGNKRWKTRWKEKTSPMWYICAFIPKNAINPLCIGSWSIPWWWHWAICSVGSGVTVQNIRCPTAICLSYYFHSGTHQSSLMDALLLINRWDRCLWIAVSFRSCILSRSF